VRLPGTRARPRDRGARGRRLTKPEPKTACRHGGVAQKPQFATWWYPGKRSEIRVHASSRNSDRRANYSLLCVYSGVGEHEDIDVFYCVGCTPSLWVRKINDSRRFQPRACFKRRWLGKDRPLVSIFSLIGFLGDSVLLDKYQCCIKRWSELFSSSFNKRVMQSS